MIFNMQNITKLHIGYVGFLICTMVGLIAIIFVSNIPGIMTTFLVMGLIIWVSSINVYLQNKHKQEKEIAKSLADIEKIKNLHIKSEIDWDKL